MRTGASWKQILVFCLCNINVPYFRQEGNSIITKTICCPSGLHHFNACCYIHLVYREYINVGNVKPYFHNTPTCQIQHILEIQVCLHKYHCIRTFLHAHTVHCIVCGYIYHFHKGYLSFLKDSPSFVPEMDIFSLISDPLRFQTDPYFRFQTEWDVRDERN